MFTLQVKSNTNTFNIERDLDEVIIESIDKLTEDVKQLIQKALKKTEKVMTQILAEFDEAVNLTIVTSTDVIDNTIDTIEKLKNEAAKLGKDIEKCTDAGIKKLEEFKVIAIAECKECAKSNAERIRDIYDDFVITENTQVSIIETEKQKVKECDNTLCKLAVQTEVAGLTLSIPLVIGKYLTNTLETLAQIAKDLALCLADLGVQHALFAANVLKSTKECITSI